MKIDLNFYIYIFLFFDLLIIVIILVPINLFNFHPLIIRLLLVLYTIIVTFKINFFVGNYWYSYIIFLVIIGGLIILFLYFTRLVNNQLFYLNKNYYYYINLKFIFFLLNLVVLLFNLIKNLYINNFFDLVKVNFILFNEVNLIKNLIIDFTMDINIYIIIYLFFTIVCSVLVCKKNNVPLRQMLKLS